MSNTELSNDKQLELTRNAPAQRAWTEWRAAKSNAEQAERELNRARVALDAVLGSAEEVLLGGAQVAKYAHDGAFNKTRFQAEMPHIAKQYTRWVPVERFDADAFGQDNPELYEQFRTRTLKMIKAD